MSGERPVPSGYYEAGEPGHRTQMWERAVRDDPAVAYWHARDCYMRTGEADDLAAMLACLDPGSAEGILRGRLEGIQGGRQ